MTRTLKQIMGEAGALLGESTGFDKLYSILQELCLSSAGGLDQYQGTIAAADIAGKVMNRAAQLVGLRTAVAVCGTAGTTTVQVHVNGSAVSGLELSTGNAEADGTKKTVTLATPISLAAGDLVEIVVSAAPTAGTGLSASAIIYPDIVVE